MRADGLETSEACERKNRGRFETRDMSDFDGGGKLQQMTETRVSVQAFRHAARQGAVYEILSGMMQEK